MLSHLVAEAQFTASVRNIAQLLRSTGNTIKPIT